MESDDARLKGGTGLGLAICRASVVEQHGGASGVEAQSEGPGAVFWFTLPAADPGTP